MTEEKEQMVQISKSSLDKIMQKLEALEKSDEMLLKVADKGRMARFRSEHAEKVNQVVRLSTIDGKIIVKWDKMTMDFVGQNPNTKQWQEIQKTKVHFEDGSEKEYDYLDLALRKVSIEAEVIKSVKMTDEKGERELFTVLVEGRQLEIDSLFVN